MATKLPTPTNFRCTQANQTSLTLAWDRVRHADHYNLTYYKNTEPSNAKTVFPTETTYTATDLTSGATYTFLLSASPGEDYTEKYTDSDSAFLFATTTMKLTTPTGLTATNIKSTSAQLNWNEVTNATDYKVEYRRQGDTTWNE